MTRLKDAKRLKEKYFNDVRIFDENPDLQTIYENYVYGDVYHHGQLDIKYRQLISIVVFITNHTLEILDKHIEAALKMGLTPLEINEAMYQCVPYIGFLKVSEALSIVNKVYKSLGITLPLKNTATTTEQTRLEKGFAIQAASFGKTLIQKGHDNAPEDLKHIQNYLSAYCFGDFYTREGLNLKIRELLTFTILATLGGCESQLRSHTEANIRVGNTRAMLIETITQCQPYIGFPRTLNAITIINEVTLK